MVKEDKIWMTTQQIYNAMGKFKIVSENWTFGWFTSYLVVHLTLSMVVRVIFDKSEVWPRKSRFEFQNYQKLSLKISELGSDDSEIFFGGVYLDLEVLPESKKVICRRRRIRFTAYAILMIKITKMPKNDILTTF